MKKLFAGVASLLLTASVPAGAADMPPVAAVAPAPLFDWNGFYIGANFAYSQGRTHDSFLNGTQPLPIARDSSSTGASSSADSIPRSPAAPP